MPKPRDHDDPLRIEKINLNNNACYDQYDWIEYNSLKAQKLNIYQVLAPNAYSCVEHYVPILNKTVQSQIYEVHTFFSVSLHSCILIHIQIISVCVSSVLKF